MVIVWIFYRNGFGLRKILVDIDVEDYLVFVVDNLIVYIFVNV